MSTKNVLFLLLLAVLFGLFIWPGWVYGESVFQHFSTPPKDCTVIIDDTKYPDMAHDAPPQVIVHGNVTYGVTCPASANGTAVIQPVVTTDKKDGATLTPTPAPSATVLPTATARPNDPPVATATYIAPLATATYVAPAGDCKLSIETFKQMWQTSPVSDGPGPLIVKLDTFFDGGGWHCGGASATGHWMVPAGTMLWTNLNHLPVYDAGTTNPVNRDTNFVFIRTEGEWGVFYVYANVDVPTPGRYVQTDRFLDPAGDLTGWTH